MVVKNKPWLAAAAATATKWLGKQAVKKTIKNVRNKLKGPKKTKSSQALPIVRGQGATSSWYPRSRKPKFSTRVVNSISGRNLFQYNGTQRLQAPAGKQNATSMLFYDYLPLNSQMATLPSSANISKRMFLDDTFCEYTVANASNTITYLTVYDLWFKREMDQADTPEFVPEGAWNLGETQEGNPLGLTMIGSYPTRVSLFNEYYKIAQKRTHMLGPGDVHKHKVHIRPNKFITQQRISDSIRYAGLTACTMFVASGTPVDNSGTTMGYYDASANLISGAYDASGNMTNNVTTGNVTTSPVALNIVWSGRYQYRWIQDVDSDIYTSNNLITGVNVEVMNTIGQALPYDET